MKRINAGIFVIAISVALLLTFMPVGCFAESDTFAANAVNQPIPELYAAPSPILGDPVMATDSQTSGIPVKLWKSSVFSVTPFGHETMIPENQLVSAWGALAKGGNGISYPGGMAAAMGGGGAMGGSGGGGGGCCG